MCFLQLKQAKCSRTLLIKALHYAWYVGSIDYESQIYDDLGLFYYYQANMDFAYYFHTRAMRQLLQDPKLPMVIRSDFYIEKNNEIKYNLFYRYKKDGIVHKMLADKNRTSYRFRFKDLERNLLEYLPQGKDQKSLRTFMPREWDVE